MASATSQRRLEPVRSGSRGPPAMPAPPSRASPLMPKNHRCFRRYAMRRIAVIALIVMTLSLPIPALAQSATPAASSPSAASGDFSGLVDIGGRSLYLECRGEGSPTVILVAGYRASGRYWTDDLLQPDDPRQMVLAGVAETTRVCTYDRPGTVASIGEDDFVSRSDAIAQPRTSMEVVTELHALLQVAQIPGPYVLAGHSLGGFFARLYA